MEETKGQFDTMEMGGTQDEERKSESQSVIHPAALETFDGDLDDLMSWSNQVAAMEQEQEASSEEDDGIEKQEMPDGQMVEWFNIRAEQELEVEVNVQSQDSVSVGADVQPDAEPQINAEIQPNIGAQKEVGTQSFIDVNDPHYVNYVPDMYYEYGVGSEPQMPTKSKGSGRVSGMAIASLCCGSASIIVCCGYGTICSILGIVFGTIVLSRKDSFGSNKTMAIIGVILSAISMIFYLLSYVFGILLTVI